MKILSNAIVWLFLCCFAGAFASAETRVMQLFISNQNKDYRHTFLYNSSGQVQLETKYVLSARGEWERESQTEWFYSGDNCVKQVQRDIENGAWKNTDEIVRVYSRIGELQDEYLYQYVGGVQTPIKRTKYIFEKGTVVRREEYAYFNDAEQLILSNAFTYEGDKVARQVITAYESGTAKTVYSSVFDYLPNGAVKSQQVSQLLKGSYQNLDSITWFYDDSDRLVSQRSKTWNVKNEAWENARIVDYAYDESSHLVSETYLCWGGMAWENVCRYEYLYEDGVQYQRSLQTQLYREWRNMQSVHYSEFVDGKAREISSEYDFWGGDKGELVRSHIPFMFNDEWVIREAESIRVDYDDPSSVTNNSNGVYPLVQVYPNPSDGVFYLNTEAHEIVSWSVYDLKGQLIKSKVQTFHTGVIDITEVVKGIYILRVETTAGIHQQKLVKQ